MLSNAQPGSMKTLIVPPQARPTSQAESSATPNSIKRGFPSLITSIDSSITAPSTHPALTEPAMPPSFVATILEPTGRGAEPQVSTTVVIANSWSLSRQISSLSITSLIIRLPENYLTYLIKKRGSIVISYPHMCI